MIKRITLFDIFIIMLLLTTGIYILYRIRVGLHYEWNWDAIPQYFFRFDHEKHRWVPNLIMQGFFTTIRLSIWGTILAAIIGTLMGFCRVSKGLFNRLLGGAYVELIRNLPPLILIFIFYFFISSQVIPLFDVEGFFASRVGSTQTILSFLFGPTSMMSAFLSALITLALFEGAYITEIVRSGIQSIDKGQWDASYAMGLSRWQGMRHIILPQAVRRILPPLAGQFISTIKDSAIVSVISVQDLTFQGMELMSSTYLTFEVWISITLLYLMLALIVSLGIGRLELFLRKREA